MFLRAVVVLGYIALAKNEGCHCLELLVDFQFYLGRRLLSRSYYSRNGLENIVMQLRLPLICKFTSLQA